MPAYPSEYLLVITEPTASNTACEVKFCERQTVDNHCEPEWGAGAVQQVG